jgi:DNA polymerase-3 subunit gamma/tau
LFPFLASLSANDGHALMQHIAHLGQQGVNFNQVLTDLLAVLHKISVTQVVTDIYQTDDDFAELTHYAKAFSAEDVQLFYQIGLVGNRDLVYAPSLRSGFEMTLLRMLHFMPQQTQHQTPIKKTTPTVAPVQKKAPTETVAVVADEKDWSSIVNQLKLSGMTKVLAQNCALAELNDDKIVLHLTAKHASFCNDKLQKQLCEALETYFAHKLVLKIEVVEKPMATPASLKQEKKDKALKQAKTSITDDPHVQSILQDFGGSLDHSSIKPTKT